MPPLGSLNSAGDKRVITRNRASWNLAWAKKPGKSTRAGQSRGQISRARADIWADPRKKPAGAAGKGRKNKAAGERRRFPGAIDTREALVPSREDATSYLPPPGGPGCNTCEHKSRHPGIINVEGGSGRREGRAQEEFAGNRVPLSRAGSFSSCRSPERANPMAGAAVAASPPPRRADSSFAPTARADCHA